MIDPQACDACLNAGAFGSIPLPARIRRLPPLLPNVGSGKVLIPWARIHRENASIW